MATRILKPSQDRDLYLVWTTTASGPVFAGSRKKTAKWLRDEYVPSRGKTAIKADIERRLARVDRLGTSESHRQVSIWGDPHLSLSHALQAL